MGMQPASIEYEQHAVGGNKTCWSQEETWLMEVDPNKPVLGNYKHIQAILPQKKMFKRFQLNISKYYIILRDKEMLDRLAIDTKEQGNIWTNQ